MKNLSRFFVLGALAAGMASCSNDIAPDGPGQQEVITEGGYLAVNIQLPTQPSTRAINDNFDDGEAYEYAVNNAAIVLFQGANEKDATFLGAYELVRDMKDDSGNGDKDDNITVSHRMVAKISNSVKQEEDNNKLFALALVNYTNDIAKVGTDGTLTIGSESLTATSTFKDLLWKTSTDAFYSTASTSNFFMTNAPLCTTIGGTTAKSAEGLKNENVFTLAPFALDKIKPTRNEAIDNPAADIYVERAVAKVTMGWDSSAENKTFTLTNRKDMNLTAELVGWTVNNTEASSYIVRNLGFDPVSGGTTENNYLAYTSSNLSSSNYRFVGHSTMGKTNILHPNELDNLYRTYWCVDPHYNTNLLADTDDGQTVADTDWSTDVKKAFYPHENTFSVANQNFKNTSRVLLKVKINVEGATNGTFYKLNDKIYAQMKGENGVESYAIEEIINDPSFLTAVETALKAEGKTENKWGYKQGDLTLTYETQTSTGKVELKSVTCAGQLAGKIDNFDFKNIIDRVNLNYETYEYTGGICYYDLKIMHFASNNSDADLAPWTASKEESATTTDAAYDGNSANYLGRYGMVRNNWYDINVTGVADVGSPVVPNANVTTSDDNNEVERYIAFKLHILSWAKRTNDYILQ